MKNESEPIRGAKIFKKLVTVTENYEGTLNDYNITKLEKVALSRTKPQNITGFYTVEKLKANDIEVEFLGDISAKDLLFQQKMSEQVINSNLIFNNIAVAGDIKAVNFMNHCDLNKVTVM